MLNPDIFCFENSVDPDQLASEKPADQDPHSFHSACKYMLINGILLINWLKLGRSIISTIYSRSISQENRP